MQPDAIVVGGGPVGSYAALNLAKLGVNTAVFEEHSTIGVPSHCAGHISIHSLKSMGLYPLPKGIIENNFCAANFYSPIGSRFSLKLSCPVTTSLNRALFDQYLAKQAQDAGASYFLNSRVQNLIQENENATVKGVKITTTDGLQDVYSKMVLDAEGVSSRLLRQAGLAALNPSYLVYAVEAEMENVLEVAIDAVEVYFGKGYAPGFYGWLIPRRDGSAKVGLATSHGDPRQYLKRLMSKHPVASKQLSKAKIKQIGYHTITLGGPISRTYTDGFLAIGDCASQVKPTTGGGVIFGLTCAKIAAQVASKAIKQGKVSADFLREYQKLCDSQLNFDFKVMLRLRRFLNSLSDEKLDEMLRVCAKLGVDKALRNVDEVDFQGRMLLTAVKKPAVAAMLAYFAMLYLNSY